MMRLASLAALCLFVVLPSVASADALVGTWKITVTPGDEARAAGERKDFQDTITLKGSKFVSERWRKAHKFEPVAYEEDTRRGPIATFTAKPQSKTGGTMQWTGRVTGNVMEGEITWTKPDGAELTYTFKGEKK